MSVQPVRQTELEAAVERLIALEDSDSRRQLIAQHSDIEWDEVVTTLTERVWQEVRVDSHRADRIADAAIDIAQSAGSQISLARSFRAKANSLYTLDQHAAAIEHHEKAAACFEQAGDEAELARTLSGSIQPLLLLGRYDEAFRHLSAGNSLKRSTFRYDEAATLQMASCLENLFTEPFVASWPESLANTA